MRKRYVTRNVKATKVDIITPDMETMTFVDMTVSIPGQIAEQQIPAALKRMGYPNAKVKGYSVEEVMYRMDEEVFIQYAQVIPAKDAEADKDEEGEE